MQTVKTLIIGLFIYGLSGIGISAFSFDNITPQPKASAPATLDNNPDTSALSKIASKAFVSSMFKNRDIYVEFLKHLHTSLSLKDNFKDLNDFLSARCRNECDVKSISAVLEKLRAANLFFWIGKYRTNLTFNNRGQTFTVFITNGSEVENDGKVVDGSVFINNIPIYSATFKNRQLTWDYDTNLILSNKSKGNLTFSDVLTKDSYEGRSFLGTLMVNSKITGKEETHKFIGFSRVQMPTKLSAKRKDSLKGKSGSKSGSGSGSDSGSDSENGSESGSGNNSENNSAINHYQTRAMEVSTIDYKTQIFGSQVWTVENMHHFPTELMTGVFTGDNDDIKYYEWASAMNTEVTEASQGICAKGWHIPTDADWKELENYFQMSKVHQNKNNAYRGKDQASMLHQGRFNAELLGFFKHNSLQEKGKEVYFASSSKSIKGHFTGRKISTVPTSNARFVLIKQVTLGKMAIGEVEVMYRGKNIALYKKTTSQEASMNSKPFVWAKGNAIIDGKTSTGLLSADNSNNKWIVIDLGSEYKIDSIKIKDLIHDSKRISAKELAIFTSKKAINFRKTLQELRDDPEVENVGISIMRPSTDPDHNFIISAITLDLWRGDIDNTIGSSVRCIQNDTIPNLAATSIENNIQIGKPIEPPIRISNFTSGGVDSWSISPALDNGLVFGTKTGVISGTPNKLQSRTKYKITATNGEGTSTIVVYITILPILINNIEISGKDVLKIGETTQLSAIISPSNANNQTLSWFTDKVASIDKTGKVTGLEEGIASIRAVSSSGLVVGRFEILVVDSQTVVVDKKSYKIVLSQATGKAWLDRNLGASRACKTVSDVACYGDLYQWGRGNDGHQSRGNVKKTTVLASSITPGNSSFITSNTPYAGADFHNHTSASVLIGSDWTADGVDQSGRKRVAAWLGTGVNNICPIGFRVPTAYELKTEFGSVFRKYRDTPNMNTLWRLPLSGNRNAQGKLENLGNKGFYWAKNSVNLTSNLYTSNGLEVDSSNNLSILKEKRIQGFSVRCIENITDAPIIMPSVEQLSASIGENITPITFANFGADASQWLINPMPNNGLSFDNHTGTISGNPNKKTPEIYYHVTAVNDSGTDTAVVRITVNSVAVPVTSIQLSHNTIQIDGKNILKVGETIQLSAGITPGNATIQDVLWTVKSNHATISGTQGVATLTGVSIGVAEVHATSLDGEYVVAKLTVHIIDTVFKGKIYNKVISPATGRVWLDRNLGASQVCVDDKGSECYGGLYQFGRPMDDHQRRINTNIQRKQAQTIKPNEDTFFTNINEAEVIDTPPKKKLKVSTIWGDIGDKIEDVTIRPIGVAASAVGKIADKIIHTGTDAAKVVIHAGTDAAKVVIHAGASVLGSMAHAGASAFGSIFGSSKSDKEKKEEERKEKAEREKERVEKEKERVREEKERVEREKERERVEKEKAREKAKKEKEKERQAILAQYANPPQKYDWTVADKTGSSRVQFWSNDSGNGICPVGFRVPSIGELNAEMDYFPESGGVMALKSFLKLPAAGKRQLYDGVIKGEGIEGYYWSNTSLESHHTQSLVFSPASMRVSNNFNENANLGKSPARMHTANANGYSIRCISSKITGGMEIKGIKYKTVRIGKQVWTAENMRHVSGKNTFFTNFDNGVYSYKDKLSNDKEYGKYYTWSAAMKGATKEGAQGICAPGWHIPTAYDWKVLQRYLGMDTADLNKNGVWIGNDQGTQLKVGGASGFEAVMTGVTVLQKINNIVPINSNPYDNNGILNGGIVSGIGISNSGPFNNIGFYNDSIFSNIPPHVVTTNIKRDRTYFWSSSSHSGVAWSMGLDQSKPTVYYGNTIKSNALSVRCIKNNKVPTYKKGMEIESIKYKTVQIGKQVWTAENMRHVSGKNTFFTNFDNGIYSYKDKLSNDKEYGKYYTWSAAMKGATKEGAQGICAPGWHIPTAYDWKVLQRYLGMDTADLNKNGVWIGNDQGTQLKVGGASGFEAVMTGVTVLNIVPINPNPYYNKDIFNGGIANGLGMEDHGLFHGGIVSDIGIVSNPKPFDIYDLLNNIAQPDSTINIEQDRTYFWSSSSHSGVAWSMGLDRSKPTVYYGNTVKSNALSVRCIKNSKASKKADMISKMTNIALNKPTAQSSTFATAASSRAVDGNTNGDYFHNSVSSTQPELINPWWHVDLQKKSYIAKINIFNRTDCCKDRLGNYRVTIADDASFTQVKYVNEFYTAPNPQATIDLSAYNVTGRYIKVEALKVIGETAYLSLAEVQVIGAPAPD